jgi:hypothetical protein
VKFTAWKVPEKAAFVIGEALYKDHVVKLHSRSGANKPTRLLLLISEHVLGASVCIAHQTTPSQNTYHNMSTSESLHRESRFTYAAYKIDTDFVLEWLVNAAHDLGYDIEQYRRSTGTDPNSTARFEVPLSDIVPLSEVVSSRWPEVPITRTFILCLREAIHLRAVFATLFQDSDDPEVQASNARHRHFDQQLLSVLTLLEPLQAQQDPRLVQTHHRQSTVEDVPEDDSVSEASAGLSNALQEAKLDDDVSEQREKEEAVSAETKSFRHRIAVKEEEEEMSMNRLSGIINLLIDLHKIRNEVEPVWRRYISGTCDLSVAANLANTAIDLGNNLIRATLKGLRIEGDNNKFFATVYRTIRHTDPVVLEQLFDTSTNESSIIFNDIHQLMFGREFVIASSLVFRLHEEYIQRIRGMNKAEGTTTTPGPVTAQDADAGATNPQTSVLTPPPPPFNEFVVIGPFSIGERETYWMTEDKQYMFFYPPYARFPASGVQDGTWVHDSLLDTLDPYWESLLLPDKNASSSNTIFDKLHALLREATTEGVSLSTAFAVRIFHDSIVHLRETPDRPLEDVTAAAKDVRLKARLFVAQMKKLSSLHPILERNAELPWAHGVTAFARMDEMAASKILADEPLVEDAEISFHLPEDSELFLSSPLAAGLHRQFLYFELSRGAMLLYNSLHIPMGLAHFYNTARVTRKLAADWNDLQYFIDNIGQDHIFFGPTPDDAFQCATRYRAALLGASGFTRKSLAAAMSATPKISYRRNLWDRFVPLTQLLLRRALYDGAHDHDMEDVELALLELELKGHSYNIQFSPVAQITNKNELRARHRRKSLAPIELLRALETHASREMKFVLFDHTAFGRRCTQALDACRTAMDKAGLVAGPSALTESKLGALFLEERVLKITMLGFSCLARASEQTNQSMEDVIKYDPELRACMTQFEVVAEALERWLRGMEKKGIKDLKDQVEPAVKRNQEDNEEDETRSQTIS